MSISLRGGPSELTSLGELTERAMTVLTMIPDAVGWVEWAVNSASSSYEFGDENELIGAVQTGLHGTGLMSLDRLGLLVSPLKLLELAKLGELNTAQLNALLEFEQGDSDGNDAPAIVHDCHLMTQRELLVVDTFMNDNKCGDLPFLQVLTLGQRIELAAEINQVNEAGTSTPGVVQNAVKFAAESSTTGAEFAAYFGMYFELVTRLRGTQKDKLRLALIARKNLATALAGYLRCPVFEGPPTRAALHDAVVNWTDLGFNLGFKFLARGIRQVVENATTDFQNPVEANFAADDVMATTQRVVRAVEPRSMSVTQDGASVNYQVEAANHSVELTCDASGELTIRSIKLNPIDKQPHNKG